MNKVYDDKIQASIFIKKHFQNYKNFSETKLIFFFRLLSIILENLNTIPTYAYIDVIKFNQEFTRLPETYQSVLSFRFGEYDDACHSFPYIGNKIYVCHSRASSINRDAIKKLKRNVNNYYFNSYNQNKNVNIKSETPLEVLKLCPRIENLLKRSHINSVETLMHLSKDDLLIIRGIAEATYNEIIEKLEMYIKNKA